MAGWDYDNRKEVARGEALRVAPKGWEPSLSFGSQGSFFRRDGNEWASTIVSRWVDRENNKEDA